MTKLCNKPPAKVEHLPLAQAGASLIMVLMILIIVSLIGVGGAQIALMGERGSRNDRDMQIALQAAEAALLDAVDDMREPASARDEIFDGINAVAFLAGCGSSGNSRGLCSDTLVNTPLGPKPAWLAVDFTNTDDNAPTVPYGAFTGRTFASGGAGVRPALPPRYVIELVPDPTGDRSQISYMYRVTAMGFGPRADIQAVLQMLYRK